MKVTRSYDKIEPGHLFIGYAIRESRWFVAKSLYPAPAQIIRTHTQSISNYLKPDTANLAIHIPHGYLPICLEATLASTRVKLTGFSVTIPFMFLQTVR